MTTQAELVQAQPAAGRGIATSYTHNGGGWYFVLELADPSAGSGIQWHDITALNNPRAFTGYDLTRGAENYLGRYRASVATLDLHANDDRLAPWHPDTSPLFGTHIELGPGLLIRAGFIRVSGGVTVEWLPRFTCKVSSWGDGSRSQGKVRTHTVVARDLMTALVGIPLPPRPAENWSDRMFFWLQNSGWAYGSEVYGAQFTWDGNPILALPARPESSSAINELDATLDPVGLIWYTDRRGVLIVRPAVDDTFHRDAFNAGATGNRWPSDASIVDFAWYACLPPDDPGEPTLAAAYAVDTDAVSPFGFDKNEVNVINHVRITVPGVSPAPPDIFDEDDPISIQRYDRQTYQAGWQASNDVVARQYLATRAHATAVARPLVTTNRLTNFFPGPAGMEYLGYASIQHRNNDTGYTAWGNGWLRYYRERVFPHGCDVEWEMTNTFDLYSVSSVAPSNLMRPVENLRQIGVSDWEVEVAWNNPPQTVIPTNTQIRLLPSELWSTTDYVGETADGLFWGGLAPSTSYEFQVRLIRIEDGVLTDFSPTRSLNFTTLAAEDPFIDVGDDNINIDLPIPGAACSAAWQLQSSPNGLDPWTNVVGQSGVVSTPPFKFPVSKAGLDPDLHYRVEYQEYCGGIGQGVKHSNVEPLQCLPVSKLGTPPYDDPSLVAFFPKLCPNHVEEAISGELVTLGPAFADKPAVAGIGTVLFSGDHDGVVGYGVQPLPAVASDGPLTLSIRFRLGAIPSKETRLFAYGGMGISLTSSGRLHGYVNEAGAGITFVSGASTLVVNTTYNVTLTHDPNLGDFKLYIATTIEAQALGTVGDRFNFGLYEINLPANSWISDMAVWDKVLAPGGGTLPDFDTSALFTYTGAVQHFTVPAGVTLLKLTAEGSKGGGGQGGKGERIIALHAATPLSVLDIYVGGQNWPNGGPAGFAGAFSASPGGGSTDVRAAGAAFINAWLVAAAGGGMGEGSGTTPNPFGGIGGHLVGGNGSGNQGHGATQTAGGTGGPGGDGSFNLGGTPLNSGNSFDFGGGGGGGGWYGGEGGRYGPGGNGQAGGGGGSGHVDALCTNVETFDGVVTTTGKVLIEWEGVGLTVEQHPSQSDPTSASPIQFVATFAKPVTGFGPSDVILTGTASAGCTVAVGGTGTTYTISITGMTTPGTIIVSVPGGVATSVTGAPNSPSVSTDNTVTWSGVAVPTQIVGEYILPQNLAGNDPFLSGPMMSGRTMLTVSGSGTPEVWAINLDSPGTNGGPAALSSRVAITGGTLFSGHNTTGVATGGWLWSLISGPYRIARINVATGAISGTVAVAYSHHTLGTDTSVYNSDGGNFITRIDPSGPTIVATSPNLAGTAAFMAYDAANGALWCMSWTGTGGANDRKLTRFNPSTLAIVGTPIQLPAGTGKQLIPIVDPSGTYLYAVDGGNGTIYRVTISTMAVTTFPSVISVTAANEGAPGAVIGNQLYVWHKYTLETTEAVLAKVNLTTMVATLITGYDDPYFGAHEGSHWDGAYLWLLGRNVRSGNQSDALIKLGP